MTILEQRAYEAIISMAKKDEPDYWERLRHTYTGMAMHAMMCNEKFNDEGLEDIVTSAVVIATDLVEKIKEDRL